MKKREEPEEDGSGYSWMDTYGDMVTLLLCFFVLLYSFSSIDSEKWKELVDALSGSMGNTEVAVFDESTIREQPITDIDSMVEYENRDADTDDQDGTSVEQEEINGNFDHLYLNIQNYIYDNSMENQVSVSKTENTILIRFSEIALFSSGEADILPEGKQAIISMTEIIGQNISSIEMVCIEGHTDNIPINTSEFSDNWDLSAKRATNTLRLILETDLIDTDMLSATGYGDNRSVATNDTEEGRTKNRRVDIVLQKLDVDE